MAKTGSRVDPFKGFKFLVELDAVQQAGFSECSGFGSDVESVEYREGNDPNTVRKLPGKVTYPDITLKWGMTDSSELYEWHAQAVLGTIQRKNGSVVIMDDVGKEVGRWNFYNAWPTKYQGPSLNATGKEVAIETLTVTCERLERA